MSLQHMSKPDMDGKNTAKPSRTVGEALVGLLEQAGVTHVFGIPGVHTIELYRGLAASPIRHVTPRHEQGAAFMADGFARASGRPGVCLLITGPGLTNALTAMAQARSDSIPMFVITGVNARSTLGKGRGHLHELPDQGGLAALVAKASFRLDRAEDLPVLFSKAWSLMSAGRPGPVHLEIPLDVMNAPATADGANTVRIAARPVWQPPVDAAKWMNEAERPLILAGGGCVGASDALAALAEAWDAPVVQTANARGILTMTDGLPHPLSVPASPSLAAVRDLIAKADCVLAVGTEFGPTDFDMYETGTMPTFGRLIRIDVDRAQLNRRPELAAAAISIEAPAQDALAHLLPSLQPRARSGADRAKACTAASFVEIGTRYQRLSRLCSLMWSAMPQAAIIGDSTQPVYAGNLFLEAPRPRAWFNSATGYGTLGFAIPAAIGAAIGAPETPVIALAGDGGMQFTLAEIGTAADERANVVFVVWNNGGYQEIETSMAAAGVTPEGVRLTPPKFEMIAAAWNLPAQSPRTLDELAACLRTATRPSIIILDEADFAPLET
jgi:acetolactate synthase I/II/III large subunit